MSQLDLLLINPSSRTQVYQGLGKELTAVENPVWAGLMASFCRGHGLSVEVIDAEAEALLPDQVAERVREARPALAAVVVYGHQPSASTQIMTASGLVCSAIKQQTPEQPVLLLGGHVAALPARTLREEQADFIAGGEGLLTLPALVEALRTSVPNLARVPGLWYRAADGEVRSNPDRPLLMDLNGQMPGPAWDLLPMYRYRAHNWHCLDGRNRQPYAALYTTLGCPYHCAFCCIQAPFRSGEQAAGMQGTTNSYRYWSPDTVIDQIDLLVNRYGVRNIKIADEMFVLNRKHVLAICDRLIERKYDLNLWAYTRVDTIKDGMLDRLREAGFTWLAVGIESGAERVRDGVDKSFDQQEVFEVVQRIRSAGINVIGNYIFGLPEDDAETMQATLELATELNCEFANFYSTMAYPGSPLFERAVRQGVELPRDWTGYSQHSRDCLPLPTHHLTAHEVLRFRDEAFQRYYSNPVYLAMLERRFGAGVVDLIREMTSVPLERDLLNGTMQTARVLLPEVRSELPLVH
jgi:anaerobic magnesium-protoporphyrin IX monomethyl ester cyclase